MELTEEELIDTQWDVNDLIPDDGEKQLRN